MKAILVALLLTTAAASYGQPAEKICAFVLSGDKSAGINENDSGPMFSVVKFPQALYVARCLKESGKPLDRKVTVRKRDLMQDTWSPMLDMFSRRHRFSYSELLRLSLQESDNNACDILFDEFGAPEAVERYISGIGFPDIRIRSTERRMAADKETAFLNTATAKEMADLLEWFYRHRDDNGYLAYVWQLMSGCNTGLSRLPAAVGPGDKVIHKTGTGFATETGIAAINDAGIILHPDGTHSIAVLFVLDHTGQPESAEALLSQTARELLQALSSNH